MREIAARPNWKVRKFGAAGLVWELHGPAEYSDEGRDDNNGDRPSA